MKNKFWSKTTRSFGGTDSSDLAQAAIFTGFRSVIATSGITLKLHDAIKPW